MSFPGPLRHLPKPGDLVPDIQGHRDRPSILLLELDHCRDQAPYPILEANHTTHAGRFTSHGASLFRP